MAPAEPSGPPRPSGPSGLSEPAGPAGPGQPAAPAAAAVPGVGTLRVQVVCALAPHQWLTAEVQLPAGATALQALRASGLAQRLPPGLLDRLTLGLWGRACAPEALLHDGDRVELTRPLTVDPKEARRLRYRRDGLRPKRKPPRGGA